MDVSNSFESAILKLGKRKISEEMRNRVTIVTGQFNNNNNWRKRVAMKEKSAFLQLVHSVREGGMLKVFHGIGKRRRVFFLWQWEGQELHLKVCHRIGKESETSLWLMSCVKSWWCPWLQTCLFVCNVLSYHFFILNLFVVFSRWGLGLWY